MGLSIAWAKLSLEKAGDCKIWEDLAVKKFNNEKLEFANYLAEIQVAIAA
jgi:hypothetical protein